MAKKFKVWSDKKYGVEVNVFVETAGEREGQYYADHAATRFRAATLGELEQKLRKFVKESSAIQWIPMITFKTTSENVKLKFDRFYAAKLPSGQWIKAPWSEVDDDQRIRNSREFNVWDFSSGSGKAVSLDVLPVKVVERHYMHQDSTESEFFLAYSEDLWQGFVALAARLREVVERIEQLVEDADGRAKIERLGGALLALPEGKAS